MTSVYLSNPTLTRAEFYEFLASSFSLSAEAAASKTVFLRELEAMLHAQHTAGRLTALIVDEAQSLPHELLEEIRLLSGVETTKEKVLRIILAGQPELNDKLDSPGLVQLAQRIRLRSPEPEHLLQALAGLDATRTGPDTVIVEGADADTVGRAVRGVILHEMSTQGALEALYVGLTEAS